MGQNKMIRVSKFYRATIMSSNNNNLVECEIDCNTRKELDDKIRKIVLDNWDSITFRIDEIINYTHRSTII